MKLDTAIKHLTTEYAKALKDKQVYKPVSYALYSTWRWCNAYEKERNANEKNS